MTYNPWEHAAQLGLIVRRTPALGTLGLYERGNIWLRDDMTRRVERSVLTHEIAHALHGHEPTKDLVLHARNERVADRAAARRLIDYDDLARCAAITDDLGAWALELDVTGWILEARLRDLEKTGELSGACY